MQEIENEVIWRNEPVFYYYYFFTGPLSGICNI